MGKNQHSVVTDVRKAINLPLLFMNLVLASSRQCGKAAMPQYVASDLFKRVLGVEQIFCSVF